MPVHPQDANLEQRILRLQQVVRYLHTVVAPEDAYLVALSNRLNLWIRESSLQAKEPAALHPVAQKPVLSMSVSAQ